MRLYGAIEKVEPQDDGTVRVYGIATSEAVDEQGEIVRADAIRAAIPDYMRFPALREMHQLSAAGSTLEAEVCEDGTTRIVAHVVDPVAVAKVKNQVYRGFSIGGRVTQRAAGNPKTITGLVLNEISLVDRPANPEAIFDCWKAAMPPDVPLDLAGPAVARGEPADTEHATSGPQRHDVSIQIWTCTVPDHRHLAKADALRCLKGDAGLAKDHAAKEIVAARKQKIESAGPPSTEAENNASSERLCDVGQSVARVIADLDWLRDTLGLEAANDDEQSQQRAQLQAIITELCDFLSSYANQRIDEILGETDANGSSFGWAMPETPAAGSSDLEGIAASSRKGRSDTRQHDDEIMKAKHSRTDQGLLDIAHSACNQCLEIDGLSVDERTNLEQARHHLRAAGATTAFRSATAKCATGDSIDVDFVKVLGVVTKVICKRERGPRHLIDLAHECLMAVTEGAVCEQAAKSGARHSPEINEFFKASHHFLVAAGARCEATDVYELRPTALRASETGMCAANQADALPDEVAEKTALAKVLGEVVPMIEKLTKRVDEIARTPLPPLTMAKGTVSVSKQQDRVSNMGNGDSELSPEAIAAALAKMSKEEQTLTLIKASYATPIRIPGTAADQRSKSTLDQSGSNSPRG
jgi:hypothetical protein